jgi:xylulokinase
MAGAPVHEGVEAVYAGLDLGTSGCKGVLLTADGRVVARAAARYPTHRPEPGAAEQQSGDWLKAFTSVTLGLANAVAAERWQAVGLSAMLPTLVLTDGVGAVATPGGIDAPSSRRQLEPLGPAITWEDGRAEAEGSAFREGRGGDALYRRTGQWVDGRYLVPMALRLAAREPERVGPRGTCSVPRTTCSACSPARCSPTRRRRPAPAATTWRTAPG